MVIVWILEIDIYLKFGACHLEFCCKYQNFYLYFNFF